VSQGRPTKRCAIGHGYAFREPNDIEFSGERKRVRCNEGLDGEGRKVPKRRTEMGAADVRVMGAVAQTVVRLTGLSERHVKTRAHTWNTCGR
jgi:hypothetical protein